MCNSPEVLRNPGSVPRTFAQFAFRQLFIGEALAEIAQPKGIGNEGKIEWVCT
jgi:hypothetical protein